MVCGQHVGNNIQLSRHQAVFKKKEVLIIIKPVTNQYSKQ